MCGPHTRRLSSEASVVRQPGKGGPRPWAEGTAIGGAACPPPSPSQPPPGRLVSFFSEDPQR